MASEKMINQAAMVMRFMHDYGTITQAQAIDEFGCYRLSAIIFNLRKDGHNIKTIMRQKKNRYGHNVNFAVYKLED